MNVKYIFFLMSVFFGIVAIVDLYTGHSTSGTRYGGSLEYYREIDPTMYWISVSFHVFLGALCIYCFTRIKD